MKNVLKIIILLLVFVVAAGVVYLKLVLPKVDKPENISIRATPEMIQRGAYIANHISVCIDCHSKRDWSKFSGPIVPGTEGMGGETFTKKMGLPGNFYAKNITPANIGNWTDGEIIRAITCGVDNNNNALFPIMPYQHYSKMDKEDVEAIVAYLRTLKPIKNEVPKSKPAFPMNLIINTIPQNAQPTKKPEKAINPVYGAYLTNIAGCSECHTNVKNGTPIAGMDFAGGREFKIAGNKKIVTSNITPDIETGIGNWSEDVFVHRFKSFQNLTELPEYKSPKDFQTIMPWTMYAGMDTIDLKAIYIYLKTLNPVKNKVVANHPSN
jgi:mono/diheme cytochrome c family protein